jgi:2-phosphosulfolactate phosphatase
MYYEQSDYNIKCEWGIQGVDALKDVTDVFIIVDILSFSSCIDIAVGRGAIVYPHYKRDEETIAFAKQLGAELAVSKKDDPEGKQYSLLLSTLMNIPSGTRLVLPSPNGSSISFAVNDKPLICGCLRNAKSVAEYALKNYKRISVIPAGEKWEDGSLRPSLEDMIGSGAIISYLKGSLSPESLVMLSVYNTLKNNINDLLRDSSSGKEHKTIFDYFKHNITGALKNSISGKELIERGFEKDIEIASEINVSNCVPVMVKGGFVNMELQK